MLWKLRPLDPAREDEIFMPASSPNETQTKRLSRDEAAQKFAYYKAKMNQGSSERSLAEELGIPRSTLQHWRERKDSIDAAPEVVELFESPECNHTGRTCLCSASS